MYGVVPGASFLAFVIPGLLALRSPGMADSAGKTVICVLLILLGLVGGGIGASYSLLNLITGQSQC